MNMKMNLKVFAGLLALGFAGYTAYAENVAISTYYPSPYGTYQNLDVTADAHFATASGNVGIGTASPGSKLTVNGTSSLQGNTTVSGTFSTTQGTNLATASGNVGIGTASPGYDLEVSGNTYVSGNLRLRDGGGNQGNLQITCSGGNCYAQAVYA